MAITNDIAGGAAVPRRSIVGTALRVTGGTLFAVSALFIAGFFLFLWSVAHHSAGQSAPSADAIVVLTGGSARIEAALQLLEDNRGERLLISGVHPSASRKVLRKTFATDDTRFRCCVDIDRKAMDTTGNAVETGLWAAQNGYQSLIIVTNDYHMPRSIIEMKRQMGEVELIPHAVVTSLQETMRAADHARRYQVLFGEYLKYIAAHLRMLVSQLRS